MKFSDGVINVLEYVEVVHYIAYRMHHLLEWPTFVAYQVLVTFQALPYTDPQALTTHALLKTL